MANYCVVRTGKETDTIEMNEKLIYVIEGNAKKAPDIFTLSERWTVNDRMSRLYIVSHGKLLKLKFTGDQDTDYSVVFSSAPKLINSNTFQNVEYSNGLNYGWTYSNYRINLENGLLEQVGPSVSYIKDDWEKGKLVYQRWIQEPDYIVK